MGETELNPAMSDELIQRARKVIAHDQELGGYYSIDAYLKLIPQLCDALEAARAELAQLRAELRAAEVAGHEVEDELIARRENFDLMSKRLIECENERNQLRAECDAASGKVQRMREALVDCRDAARGHWRDEWHEKYFSRIEAVNNIACEALEVKP